MISSALSDVLLFISFGSAFKFMFPIYHATMERSKGFAYYFFSVFLIFHLV